MQASDYVSSEKIKGSIKASDRDVFSFININGFCLFIFTLCVGNVKENLQTHGLHYLSSFLGQMLVFKESTAGLSLLRMLIRGWVWGGGEGRRVWFKNKADTDPTQRAERVYLVRQGNAGRIP